MKFSKFLFLSIAFFCLCANADVPGQDVYGKVVETVYQQNLDPTEFEFTLVGYGHTCGGTIFRVRSNAVEIADRKFSLVTAALVSGKTIAFRETGVCMSGGRMEVSWVKLVK